MNAPHDHRELLSAIALAHDRAQAMGHDVILRVAFPLGSQDPWLMLPSMEEPWAAFHGRGQGVTAFTEGHIWHHDEVASRSTAAQATAVSRGLVEVDASGPADLPYPLFFGGTSFARNGDGLTAPWSGWPSHRFFLPRALLWRQGGQTNLVLARLIRPEADHEEERRSLLGELQRIEERLQQGQRCRFSDRPARGRLEDVESQTSWIGRVQRARQAIDSSALEKVVLARSVTVTSQQGFCPVDTLRALRANNPDALCIGLGLGPDLAFVGATPETLVRMKDGRITTHALAGTTQRGADEEEDAALAEALLTSPKERAEHQVVVDAILRRIGPLCSRVDAAPAPRPLRLAVVQHLNTTIEATARSTTHILDLARELHPTPALGGHPRDLASDWLADNESMERGWYGAPIGWFHANGDGLFVAGIRTALLNGERATAFAGAGIVADSNPVREWEETELKLRTVVSALRVAEGPG